MWVALSAVNHWSDQWEVTAARRRFLSRSGPQPCIPLRDERWAVTTLSLRLIWSTAFTSRPLNGDGLFPVDKHSRLLLMMRIDRGLRFLPIDDRFILKDYRCNQFPPLYSDIDSILYYISGPLSRLSSVLDWWNEIQRFTVFCFTTEQTMHSLLMC